MSTSIKDPSALRIGVAGLGTVGGGVLKIIETHREQLAARAGRPITVTAVSARQRGKDRGVDLSDIVWEDDPVALARRDDVDLVVEAIGGPDGPAKAASEAALGRGAHLVTANKAMLAVHGRALATLSESKGAALRFEAAIAGGVPAVKALAEGMAANNVTRIFGVLNGTCNYILTEMEHTGRDYADVLREAQDKGYAEADPTADVGGWDAAHKICLLASIAFGVWPDFDSVSVEGIEQVSKADIQFAADFGYRLKQLAVAERSEKGCSLRVEPVFAPANSLLGALESVTNAVQFEGDFVGDVALCGPGAGEGPTASAIVADIVDIARGDRRPAFGVPAAAMAEPVRVDAQAALGAHYIRLSLVDRPGVLAQVTGKLGDAGVSIDQLRQIGRSPDPATVLFVTHEAPENALRAALEGVSALDVCLEPPAAFRIARI
ncbi:MAG: homoserine dehydrogenase [Neomegalonema sp.]|nr:homoserine dehydrogenase [Neomegalonema sp.]